MKNKWKLKVGDVINFAGQYDAIITAIRVDGRGTSLWVDSGNVSDDGEWLRFRRDNFKRSEHIFAEWGVEKLFSTEEEVECA